MLTLYLVFGLLMVELLILAALMVPYISRLTAPLVERLLVLARIPLRVILAILTLLFYEAIAEMRRRQTIWEDERPIEHFAQLEALKMKFKAERNFYLYALTFILFIVILRLDVILSNYKHYKSRALELEAKLGAGSDKKKD